MPDGSKRPYAVRGTGRFPAAFHGLFEVLSLDMRIIDPAWIGMKLRKLVKFAEPQADFMARVPASEKQATFPSTEAYIARLLMHRYAMLGILSEDGQPLHAMGVIKETTPAAPAQAATSKLQAGDPCPECGMHAVIQRDGCSFCTNCGYVGACG